MKFYYCYININESESYVFSSGMEFNTFINAIPNKISGFLLLEGNPENSQYDKHTYLEYVSEENMAAFLQEDINCYGDFSWVDFFDLNCIPKLSDKDMAKLLFAAHFTRPLDSAFFNVLNNNYLYLCHDDDYWTKVYIKNIKEYKLVIEQKIREVFMGRKKSLPPIPPEILDELYDFFKGGAAFDFENLSVFSDYTGVSIFPLKEVGFRIDDIHKEFDRQQKIFYNGKRLEYYPRSKKWALL